MRNCFGIWKILVRFTLLISVLSSSILLTVSFARADRSNKEVHTQVAQTDPWTSQVRNQLVQAARSAGGGGLRLTHDPFIGDLGRGGEDDITLNLRRGVNYVIVGVCDDDCRDIDLGLYDDNGNLVSSDIQRDDFPVIKVRPRWNARFTIRVIMANCSNAPCRYGIGAFGK
jgi:hypothetical protein